jgi:hypothetical protein
MSGDFGKLYIDKTGCIYVGNEFWALLNHQVRVSEGTTDEVMLTRNTD